MPRAVRIKTKAAPAELDADMIAAAALKVVDKRGVDGFTMRAVAEALGVTPMALYHHVADKAALALLVVEASAKKFVLPPPTGVWREDLWAIASWTRRTTLAHPAVGQLRRDYRVWTPAMLQINERWGAVWQQSGLPLKAATSAAAMSSTAIVGIVERELVTREMAPPDEKMLAWLPNARLAFTAKRDRDGEYETLIRALIDGLYERLRR